MTNSDVKKISADTPSLSKERLRLAREAAVLISKMKAIRVKIEPLYDLVESWDSCDELVSALAKHHSDYLNLLKRQTLIFHTFVRQRSIEEWYKSRAELNESFVFEPESSDMK